MSFENTRLFREALVSDGNDKRRDEREFFRQHYLALRSRVEPIVARVLRDMPGYTVHDITHLDALWETASLVADDSVSLSPPEAFVFGGAILLHDASMTLAAYPDGIDSLKSSLEWQDFSALCEMQQCQKPDDSFVLTNVLRVLHAKHAENLAVQAWPAADGKSLEFLIENNDLRRFYGPSMGSIAHSHWWPISDIATKLSSYLGAMPPYTTSSVDRLKLACLLRVADATHLDRRRAPPFVRALDRPKGYSDFHWAFQSRLSFPRLEGDALQFSAGEACPIEESESWWLGFDAFGLADRELRDTDLLLRDNGRAGLKARRIKGAQDPRELARDVPVTGWKPVNSPFHVSDVSRIISILGGSKLYGNEWFAPLRELLQNACDAIQARRRLQSDPAMGEITVTLDRRDDAVWLTIEDDGVGMSEQVLTHTLVDFGSSLWRSNAANEEFPGLAAAGMKAVGKFGIGFFSVFMIAKEVRVITRRFDHAASDALKMLFNAGVNSRPILTLASQSEAPKNGGTRIELKLFGDPQRNGAFEFFIDGKQPDNTIRLKSALYPEFTASTLAQLVAQIAPSSDVSISVKDREINQNAIHAGDWLTCTPHALANRVTDRVPKQLSGYLDTLMREIRDDTGAILGRAAIWPSASQRSQYGVLASGGFRIQAVPHVVGVILGEVETAARSAGIARFDNTAFKRWATEQAAIYSRTIVSEETLSLIAEIVLELDGEISSLPIANRADRWFNAAKLKKEFSSLEKVTLFVGNIVHSDDDDVSVRAFEANFEVDQNIFFIPTISVNFNDDPSRFGIRSRRVSRLRRKFESVLSLAWKQGWDEYDGDVSIGEVDLSDIVRETTTYTRRHRSKK